MSSNNYNNFIDSANSSEPVDEPIVSTNTSEPEAQPQGPVMEDEVSTQSQFEATEQLHTSDLIYKNTRPVPSRSSSNPCRQQSDTIDLVSDDDSPIPPHVSALPVSKDNIELIDLVSDSSDE